MTTKTDEAKAAPEGTRPVPDDGKKTYVTKLASLRSNPQAQEEGEWNKPSLLPGVRLKTRAFSHVPYRIARDQMAARMARKFKDGQSEERDKTSAMEIGRLYAEYILLDWEGFEVPYSPEVAMAELCHPAAVALRAAVEDCAQRTGLPEAEFIAAAAKN